MTEAALKLIEEMQGLQPPTSNEDYHAGPGISSTGLVKLINETPAHYRAYVTERREPTPAMEFGTAFHAAVLEPKVFAANYIQKPEDMSFATKEGKAWRAENSGKAILPGADFEKILRMRDKVLSHPIAGPLLSRGAAEQSYFWIDPETGAPCKCRPDYMAGATIVDIKTTESARDTDFQRSMMKFGYHISTAFYLRGLSVVTGVPHTDFVHIAVEKSVPHEVACYVLDDATIEKANELIDMGLARYAECLKTGEWPGYPALLQAINLPHWGF